MQLSGWETQLWGSHPALGPSENSDKRRALRCVTSSRVFCQPRFTRVQVSLERYETTNSEVQSLAAFPGQT